VKITRAELEGVFFVDREPSLDERGSFARLFDDQEFQRHGLRTAFDQVSLAQNARRGTLRGLHFQAPPHEEVKLITCVRGRGFDVVVDLRPASPTRCRWLGQELSAEGLRSLYVPEGFAHGFLALEDTTTLLYQMVGRHEPAAARGLRWNDPQLGIVWPEQPKILSARDEQWPLIA
jgi:dTDP-4-dehydrorhamnose 3,5-epimerase